MAESSKIAWLFGPGLTQRGLMLSGGLALTGMVLAFAPVLPRPSLWQMLQAPAVAPAAAAQTNSTWAGHLESPAASGTAASGGSQRPTSASYTTGFNVADAEPLPAVAPKAAAHDPNACPSNLNCAFRPKPGTVRPQMAAASTPPAPAATLPPAEVKRPTGISAFIPQMPSTDTLMKPFAFVANAFGGLMHGL
ncbi:MAG: hypothetical protein AB1508_16965 [Pseudomonadota bacterium]